MLGKQKGLNKAASLIPNELLPSLERRVIPGCFLPHSGLSILSESNIPVTALPGFYAEVHPSGAGEREEAPEPPCLC